MRNRIASISGLGFSSAKSASVFHTQALSLPALGFSSINGITRARDFNKPVNMIGKKWKEAERINCCTHCDGWHRFWGYGLSSWEGGLNPSLCVAGVWHHPSHAPSTQGDRSHWQNDTALPSYMKITLKLNLSAVKYIFQIILKKRDHDQLAYWYFSRAEQ